MVTAGRMWFTLYPIMVFFDSSVLCYLIPDSSLASHSNRVCVCVYIYAPWDQYMELGSHHLYNQMGCAVT